MNQQMESSVPIGCIVHFALDVKIPYEFLECKGQEEFVEKYPELFHCIGYTYNPIKFRRFSTIRKFFGYKYYDPIINEGKFNIPKIDGYPFVCIIKARSRSQTYVLDNVPVVEYTKVIKRPGDGLEQYYEIHTSDGKVRKLYLSSLTRQQIENIEYNYINSFFRKSKE